MLPTDPEILVRSIERAFRRERVVTIVAALMGAAILTGLSIRLLGHV